MLVMRIKARGLYDNVSTLGSGKVTGRDRGKWLTVTIAGYRAIGIAIIVGAATIISKG
jgi:hypothetical protein